MHKTEVEMAQCSHGLFVEGKCPECILEQDKHDRQTAKVCPDTFNYSVGKGHYDQQVIEFEFRCCFVEQCARWDLDRECCGMLPYKEIKISGGIDTHSY